MMYKEISSNWERRLLAIIDQSKKEMEFGAISINLKITGGKVVLVELKDVVKSYKLD